ncbi:hypothetical protein MASR2M12_02670 [Bacteroidales bacterium]
MYLVAKYFKEQDNKWDGVDIARVEIYYYENDMVASRVTLDTSFNEKKIESITDTGIQKILLAHLDNYRGKLDEKGKEIASETLAFAPEGIEELNKNIKALNGGKAHQPIYKVRTYEPRGNKFAVGKTGNKQKKYVEAAKGTNLFFGIYVNEEGKRSYETIPLNIVIERQKQGQNAVPEINENGDKLLFHLSPNDLVYVPEEGEEFDSINFNPERAYKMVSSTGSECHFVNSKIASLIKNYDAKTKIGELGSINKLETTMTLGNVQRIKEVCIKLKVDRLGSISL